jgi:hypothetical protein
VCVVQQVDGTNSIDITINRDILRDVHCTIDGPVNLAVTVHQQHVGVERERTSNDEAEDSRLAALAVKENRRSCHRGSADGVGAWDERA